MNNIPNIDPTAALSNIFDKQYVINQAFLTAYPSIGIGTTIPIYVEAKGTNDYTGTTDLIETLSKPQFLLLEFENTNTAASTFSLNTFGKFPLKDSQDKDLSQSMLHAGIIYPFIFTGSSYILQGGGSSSTGNSGVYVTDDGHQPGITDGVWVDVSSITPSEPAYENPIVTELKKYLTTILGSSTLLTDMGTVTEAINELVSRLSVEGSPIVEAIGINDYKGTSVRIKQLTKGCTFKLFVANDSEDNVPCTLKLNTFDKANILDMYGNPIYNMKYGVPYQLCWNGLSFTLLGKGGGGTAEPNNVLENYTFTNNKGLQKGTIKVNPVNSIGKWDSTAFLDESIATSATFNSDVGAWDIKIPQGYYDGDKSVRVHIPNLIANNLKSGIKYGWANANYEGQYTSDGTLDASKMLVGQKGYSKGVQVNGSMINRGQAQFAGGVGITSTYLALTKIPAGYYPSDASSWAPEIRMSLADIANAIGLTSTKLVAGNKVCGIDGAATISSLGGCYISLGQLTVPSAGTLTINCGFRPRVIVMFGGSDTRNGFIGYADDNWNRGNNSWGTYTGAWGTITDTGFIVNAMSGYFPNRVWKYWVLG